LGRWKREKRNAISGCSMSKLKNRGRNSHKIEKRFQEKKKEAKGLGLNFTP